VGFRVDISQPAQHLRQFIDRDITYRPENSRNAVAYRILDNYFKPDYKEENRLAEEISKSKFIEKAIEKVYKEFRKIPI
jgi:hypothetical protein